jgi:hypothetical protein
MKSNAIVANHPKPVKDNRKRKRAATPIDSRVHER